MSLSFKRRYIKSPILAIAVGISVFLAIVTIMSAYGGMVDPHFFPAMALLAMAFPLVIGLNLVNFIVLVIARSRLLLVPLAATLISLPPLLTFSPINIRHTIPDDKKENTFTLLTFNCLHWDEYEPVDVPVVPNPSLEYVLKANADIVCLQEASPISVSVSRGITPAQRDSMNAQYPYQVVETLFPGMSLYSKYPVTRVVLQDSIGGTSVAQAYRISIRGHLLTLINVHLQSLLLTNEDKNLYNEMTHARTKRSDMSKMRDQVFTKLYDAFKLRAVQARLIRQVVDERPGNVIVCGDFNDVAGCYAIRTIMNGDMKDAYAEAAFGPTYTYNKNRFYFRIDHILYKGDLKCVDIQRGSDVISDHYPFISTFLWTDN